MIGRTIGPYQVVARLGEGGMGEVYRATDGNLKRDVAIKVLPAAVANDHDRLARFQREAQVLAALQEANKKAMEAAQAAQAAHQQAVQAAQAAQAAKLVDALAIDDGPAPRPRRRQGRAS